MKKKSKFIYSIIVIIVLFIIIIFHNNYNYKNKLSIYDYKNLKSGNLSTDYSIDTTIENIKHMDLNTINVPIVVNIKNLNSSDMEIETWSLNRAIELIKKLKGSGVKIILEPYPWIDNGSKYETEFNPSNKNEFFYNWKTKVLNPIIKKVANPYNVFSINIASNYVYLYNYYDYWNSVVDYVRANYNGFITYKVSWWYTAQWDKNSNKNFNAILDNKILGKVDFISVAAYFELSNKEVNSVQELKSDLYSTTRYNRKQNIVKQLYEIHKKWNKPIFFGELGFPRKNGAAMEPWNMNCSDVVNNQEQSNCFKAYEEVFSKKKWILGFSVFSIGNDSPNHWYYPNEETQNIIKNWYK